MAKGRAGAAAPGEREHGRAGSPGRPTGRRHRAAEISAAALLCAWLGALAGVVEGPFRAAGHGHYFHTIFAYMSFLLVPAVLYAAFALLLGAFLAVSVSVASRRAKAVPTTVAVAASLVVFLYWGSVFHEPFFSTPGNVIGHIGMVLTAVAVFVLVRRLLRSLSDAASGRRVRVLVALALWSCALFAVTSLGGWWAFSQRDGGGVRIDRTTGWVENARSVLLVTIDTSRADHFGCYGHPLDSSPRGDGLGTSPVVDGLSSTGIRFENVIVPEVATDPSHASIMTALHPLEHGVLRNGQQLSSRFTTVAEVFHAAGYRTGAAISVEHLDGYMSGLSQGFATYYDRGLHDRFRYHLGWRSMPSSWRDEALAHTRDAGGTCRLAAKWLRRNGREPFFLWVHVFEPHMPYVSHEEPGVVFTREDAHRVEGSNSAAAVRAAGIYDSEIRRADDAVGALLAVLAELGVADETVVAVTSDHGEHMSEARLRRDQWFGHGEVYEETCRVPLVIRVPGDATRRAVTELVSSTDLAPTLIELAGVGGGLRELPGRSMVPLLSGGPWLERPVVVLSNPHTESESRALRGARWKLVTRSDEAPELYDLVTDPQETLTLSRQCPARTDSLLSILDGIIASWGEPIAQRERDPEVQETLRALGYLH